METVASKSTEIIGGYRFGSVIEYEVTTNGMDDPTLRKALWPSQIKAPMGQGQFGPHRLQTPLLILFSSYAFPVFVQCLPCADNPLSSFSPIRRRISTPRPSGSTELSALPSMKRLSVFSGVLLRPSTVPLLSLPTIPCRRSMTITSALLPLPPEMLSALASRTSL